MSPIIPMKLILFTVILFVLLSVGAFAQDNENLLSGRDAEIFQQVSGDLTCRVYTKYVVRTKPSVDGGELVEVFQNLTTGKRACSESKNLIISLSGTYTGKNTGIDDLITSSFSGLSGKYLFIQKLVEPFVGSVEIFDLSTAKSVYKDESYGNINLVQKRFFVYEKWSKKDGLLKNCKQAAAWKKGGLGIGWVRKHRLDIRSFKVLSGALRCEAQQ